MERKPSEWHNPLFEAAAMLPAALLGWHFSWLERCIVWSQALAICSSPKLCFPSFSPKLYFVICQLYIHTFPGGDAELDILFAKHIYFYVTLGHWMMAWYTHNNISVYRVDAENCLVLHIWIWCHLWSVERKKKKSFRIRLTTWFLCMWAPDWICLMLHICFGGISWARMLSPVSLVQQQPQPIAYLRTALPFACGPGRDN